MAERGVASRLSPRRTVICSKVGWQSNWPNWRKLRCPLTMPKPLKTEKDASARPEQSTGKILVAEDSAIYRRLIETHLNDWGFAFQCVRDGKEAWKLLSHKEAPRLALLDWVLPEIDGVELCRRLRNRPEDALYTYPILLPSKNRKV